MSITEGEWKFNKEAGCIESANGIMIADLGFVGIDSIEAGHLIAAAPELLFAAKLGRAYIDSVITGVPMPISDLQDNKQIVEAAIEAAKGKE